MRLPFRLGGWELKCKEPILGPANLNEFNADAPADDGSRALQTGKRDVVVGTEQPVYLRTTGP